MKRRIAPKRTVPNGLRGGLRSKPILGDKRKKRSMDSRTVTIDISSFNIAAQLEPFLIALRAMYPDEEIFDIKIGGEDTVIPITFTFKKKNES